MSGLLGGGKTIKPAPPQPIEPPPVVEDTGAGEAERRKIRRRRGRRETFLTGDLIPETDRKRRLA